MPPHACLLRSLGRHAFRVAPAPSVDHAHRPLHCKVSITRHVSLLWSGRVHGPHPFIIAERPSQLKPNAAMFHDASRECPPRDPPTWSRTVTGVGGVSEQQKISAQAVFGACHPRGSHLHQSGSSSHPKRSRQNEPHAYRGGGAGQWPEPRYHRSAVPPVVGQLFGEVRRRQHAPKSRVAAPECKSRPTARLRLLFREIGAELSKLPRPLQKPPLPLLLFFCGRRRVSELIDLLACKVDGLRCGFRASPLHELRSCQPQLDKPTDGLGAVRFVGLPRCPSVHIFTQFGRKPDCRHWVSPSGRPASLFSHYVFA